MFSLCWCHRTEVKYNYIIIQCNTIIIMVIILKSVWQNACSSLVGGSAHTPQNPLGRPCPWNCSKGIKISAADTSRNRLIRHLDPAFIQDTCPTHCSASVHGPTVYTDCVSDDGLQDTMRFVVGVIPQPKPVSPGLPGFSTLASQQAFFWPQTLCVLENFTDIKHKVSLGLSGTSRMFHFASAGVPRWS